MRGPSASAADARQLTLSPRSASCSRCFAPTRCVLSPLFAGVVPVRAVVLGLRWRGRRRGTAPCGARWLAARRLARCHPLGGARPRSGPRPHAARVSNSSNCNGKTRSSRRRPVVPRAVRLPGAVSRRPKPQPAQTATAAAAPGAAGARRSRSPTAPAAAPRRARRAAPRRGRRSSPTRAERDIVVENDAVRAVFTTRGARR